MDFMTLACFLCSSLSSADKGYEKVNAKASDSSGERIPRFFISSFFSTNNLELESKLYLILHKSACKESLFGIWHGSSLNQSNIVPHISERLFLYRLASKGE